MLWSRYKFTNIADEHTDVLYRVEEEFAWVKSEYDIEIGIRDVIL
jgi:hypothetical protein